MADLKQEEELRAMAELIEKSLELIYGKKMGFMINIASYDADGGADYIGNVTRDTATAWMKECVGRFENNENIPASQGRMQ